MPDESVVKRVVASVCFQTEVAYLRRGNIETAANPRLYKKIDDRLFRLIFPTKVREVDDGTVVGMVCLWDAKENSNVYAHCISAGPGVNAQLRTIHSSLNQVKPQPGIEGDRAILKFVAWKQASWGKFLNEELALGTAVASERWLADFWKALDRMYGGGNLCI